MNRATVAELRARGLVPEPLDEERRRGHALAEAVRALLRLDAVCDDEVGAALEEYDEPARPAREGAT